MNRKRFARLAVRTYPTEARAARGAELVSTLLDAGEDSRTAFARQLGSVFRAGLVARARMALTRPRRQLVIYALAWAAVMTVFRNEVSTIDFAVHFLERGTGRIVYPAGMFVTWVLPALVVLAFTLRRSRTAGLLGIALITSRFVTDGALDSAVEISLFVLPAAGSLLMTITPNQIPSSGRWVFLVPAGAFLYFAVTQAGFYSGADIIVPLLIALCFLPIEPAFVIGTGLAWSVPTVIGAIVFPSPGRWTMLSIALIASVPLTVTATWLGRRQATER